MYGDSTTRGKIPLVPWNSNDVISIAKEDKIYVIIGQVLSFNKYVKVLKRRSGWILRMSTMIYCLNVL